MMAGRSQGKLAPGQIVAYQMDGIDEIINALKRMGDEASRAVFKGAMAGGQVIADEANKLGPGGKGVVVEPAKDGIQPGSVTVEIGMDKKHWYWLFLETGVSEHEIIPATAQAMDIPGGEDHPIPGTIHPGFPARPFLRPAFDRKIQAAIKVVGETIIRIAEEKTS